MADPYTTPWTFRVYEALPGHPISIGTVFAVGMIVVFFVGRAFFGGAAEAADKVAGTIAHVEQDDIGMRPQRLELA